MKPSEAFGKEREPSKIVGSFSNTYRPSPTDCQALINLHKAGINITNIKVRIFDSYNYVLHKSVNLEFIEHLWTCGECALVKIIRSDEVLSPHWKTKAFNLISDDCQVHGVETRTLKNIYRPYWIKFLDE